MSHKALRQLQKGYWPIEARLDLHGYTGEQSRLALQQFIVNARQQQLRCILVIHGKGLSSPHGQAVLPLLTRNWLTQLPSVLAYTSAPQKLGGHGATIILLSQKN